jgi:hypothetical protein
MADKDVAIQALTAAIETNEAARDKLEQVIVRKKVRMQDVEEERARVAEINREIGDWRNLRAELRAAAIVVSAPTTDEINAVVKLQRQIQTAAIEDATVQATLDLIKQGIGAAGTLRDKVRTT